MEAAYMSENFSGRLVMLLCKSRPDCKAPIEYAVSGIQAMNAKYGEVHNSMLKLLKYSQD